MSTLATKPTAMHETDAQKMPVAYLPRLESWSMQFSFHSPSARVPIKTADTEKVQTSKHTKHIPEASTEDPGASLISWTIIAVYAILMSESNIPNGP